MSLIGILVEKKSYENYIKAQLKDLISEDWLIFLNEKSIQNLKNIKFQTILIGKEIVNCKEQIRQIAKKAEYLIFNTDIMNNINLLEDLNLQLITYGFNSKATITTSSIEDGECMICLQRAIQNANGIKIEPQELEMNFDKKEYSNVAMEVMALKLLYKK